MGEIGRFLTQAKPDRTLRGWVAGLGERGSSLTAADPVDPFHPLHSGEPFLMIEYFCRTLENGMPAFPGTGIKNEGSYGFRWWNGCSGSLPMQAEVRLAASKC